MIRWIAPFVIAASTASAQETPEEVPEVEWRPAAAPNYRVDNRGPNDIDAIVVHDWGDLDLADVILLCQDPAERRAPHYVIGDNGRIVQMVALKDVAFHARDWNEWSIGIECAKGPRQVWTDALLRSLVVLVRWLCQQYSIARWNPLWPANEAALCAGGIGPIRGIFGHRDVHPCEDLPLHIDPVGFPWESFLHRINKPARVRSVSPGGSYAERHRWVLQGREVTVGWEPMVLSPSDPIGMVPVPAPRSVTHWEIEIQYFNSDDGSDGDNPPDDPPPPDESEDDPPEEPSEPLPDDEEIYPNPEGNGMPTQPSLRERLGRAPWINPGPEGNLNGVPPGVRRPRDRSWQSHPGPGDYESNKPPEKKEKKDPGYVDPPKEM